MTCDILTEFANYQRAKGLSFRTIKNRDYMLRSLERAAQTPLLAITLQAMRAHLGRGISRGSMQTERDCYRAFYRFAKSEGHISKNPTKGLEKVQAPRGVPRPYSRAQIESLLTGGAYRRTRAMILLAYYQGFRASEVAAIHGHDIDLAGNTLRVVGKGGKDVVLPLHPVIRALALTMPHDDWWFPARKSNTGHIHSRSVSDLMTRAKQRAGIRDPKLTGHSLRHSFGTDLVDAGVDIRIIQELMRHSSLATTQIYTGVKNEQKVAGIVKLPAREIPSHSGRKAAA